MIRVEASGDAILAIDTYIHRYVPSPYEYIHEILSLLAFPRPVQLILEIDEVTVGGERLMKLLLVESVSGTDGHYNSNEQAHNSSSEYSLSLFNVPHQ